MTSSKHHSSLLPLELIEEILYKIPIESLLRFKPICKEWYTLLSDKRFIYKSSDLSRKRFMQLDAFDKSIQLFDQETQAPMRLPLPDELHGNYFEPRIHCDGLFLCEYIERVSGDINRKLAVWNPILRRVKCIEPSDSYKYYDVYGFGYDKNVSRENYKILRLNNNEFGKSSEVEIFEFKSKRWRSVDAPGSCVAYEYYGDVSMNGNMYWISHLKKMVVEALFIQSFDFSTETFKRICSVPGIFCVGFDRTILALSSFQGDRLSLLHQQHEHVKIEVWVTNKVTDGVVSWSKYFDVTRPDGPILEYSYFFHKTNKMIMLWCKEIDQDIDGEIMLFCGEVDDDIFETYVHANVYETGEGQIKKQVEAKGRYRSGDCLLIFCKVYVPTLVPVPE